MSMNLYILEHMYVLLSVFSVFVDVYLFMTVNRGRRRLHTNSSFIEIHSITLHVIKNNKSMNILLSDKGKYS